MFLHSKRRNVKNIKVDHGMMTTVGMAPEVKKNMTTTTFENPP